MAKEYGVNRAVLWRIVNEGYEPKAPRIRLALGLSDNHEEVINQVIVRDEKGRFAKASK